MKKWKYFVQETDMYEKEYIIVAETREEADVTINSLLLEHPPSEDKDTFTHNDLFVQLAQDESKVPN